VNLRQLPNAITVARMLMVPALLWCLHAGKYDAALWIAVIAGASDAIDGWLAKRFGWQSWLGGVLDPLADKFLLDASFVGLWFAHAAPGWMAALVVGRDVVIVAGASAYHFLIGTLSGSPSLLSKLTTVAQIVFVVVLLLGLAWHPLPAEAILIGTIAVAALTFGSGLDYVVRWGLRARNEWRAKHQ
jgi:cardiolipin synthase